MKGEKKKLTVRIGGIETRTYDDKNGKKVGEDRHFIGKIKNKKGDVKNE